MSYNIGDKFIIEIDRIYTSKRHEVSRYGIKGFSCLIFDDYGLKKLDEIGKTDRILTGEDFERILHDSYEAGYKDCLSENDFDQPCASCDEYGQGLKDAWKTAHELYWIFMKDCVADSVEFDKAFGLDCSPREDVIDKFFNKYSPDRASLEIKEFHDRHSKPDIRVGDEVTAENGTATFIVTHIGKDISGIDMDGKTYAYMPEEITGKTGRRIPITEALKCFM